MPPQLRCPRCRSRKAWVLKDGRRRCAKCRFDWRPERWPLRLTAGQWRLVVRWFARGVTSATVAEESGLERKRVLRALNVIRHAIVRSTSPDEAPLQPPNSSRDAPVIGLSVAGGRAWAAVLPESTARGIRRKLRERKLPLRVELPDRVPYGAVAYRGRFYRLAASGTGHASSGFGELESFWGYLRRQLGSKGGIRRERLGLYLAEYAWRYNRRRVGPAEQTRELLELVNRSAFRWGEWDFTGRR